MEITKETRYQLFFSKQEEKVLKIALEKEADFWNGSGDSDDGALAEIFDANNTLYNYCNDPEVTFTRGHLETMNVCLWSYSIEKEEDPEFSESVKLALKLRREILNVLKEENQETKSGAKFVIRCTVGNQQVSIATKADKSNTIEIGKEKLWYLSAWSGDWEEVPLRYVQNIGIM